VAVLLEREQDMDRLVARLEAARAGDGAVAVIEGAPGIGKTSLLRAATRAGERRGFEVLRARGAALERDWPFGAVRQLLEPALGSRSADARAELLEGAARLAAPVVSPESADAAVAVDAGSGRCTGCTGCARTWRADSRCC
jgi:predicted ATPase